MIFFILNRPKFLLKKNMKKTILFLAYSCLSQLTIAQTFDWAKQMGGATDDIGNSIAIDASGNVYTTGQFTGTVDFDPGVGVANLTAVQYNDIFIQKLDANGNFLWVKHMGGGSDEIANSIAVDLSGNVYITGHFAATVDFDPGAGVTNLVAASIDAFVQKLDANGNLLWVIQLGGSAYDYGNSITTDASGNVYTTGSFSGTADFDPGVAVANLSAAGGTWDVNVFIQKLDANGNFIWAKQMGGLGNDVGNSITTDASGNVYTTGHFTGVTDFDPGAGTEELTSVGYTDAFIQKLDTNGDFAWVKQLGGNAENRANSISVDVNGNIYTIGDFAFSIDMDPGAGSFNLTALGSSWDVFIQKLDPNGDFVWAKQLGGYTEDKGKSITTDASGNVYTTGYFRGNADFDPGVGILNMTSTGITDVFVQKLNANGDLIWVEQLGGVYNNYGNSIATVGSGTVYVTGFFTGSDDFDPGVGTANLTSLGSADIFIQKTSCTHTSSIASVNACDSFTWIDGNSYTSSNSTATYMLANAQGCDSIITLNLVISPFPNSTVSQSGATFIVAELGSSYQWIDCANNNAPIVGDTAQSFTPQINGSYAVIVDNGSCSDTSACFVINNVGITENELSTIQIYPNPTHNTLTIKSEIVIDEIRIYTIEGKKITIQRKINNTSITIDLSTSKSGVYLVEVVDINGDSKISKITKQ
jgi:hypothetical protein